MAEVLSKIPEESTVNSGVPSKPDDGTVSVMDIPVTDENSRLNVMGAFLGVAQKRGTFAINESAKIYECIQVFQNSATKEKKM